MTTTSTSPTISVVIPAYNAGEDIVPTLESIFEQTVAPNEIIVVNDGSKDNTSDVVRRFADRITLIEQENGGPAVARDTGIKAASGDWIAFLDADDIWLPNKLERQIPHLLDGVGIVHCYEVDGGDEFDFEITFEELWKHNYIGTSTVVLRKRAYEDVGGFELERKFVGAEDYNLWLRILHAGHKIHTVREELILYTPAEDSLSQRYASVIRAEILNVDTLAEELGISSELVHQKKAALYDEYANGLLWKRDLPLARKYFGELIKEKPSIKAVVQYLTTFLPRTILDMKRKANVQNA